MKRIDRVWAKRYRGGYILWVPKLMEKLTNTHFIEFRGITVATKDLRDVLKNGIQTEDCLFRVNGGLQVEEIQRYTKPNPDVPGTRVIAHRRTPQEYIHKIKRCKVEKHNGQLILVLKPKIYGRKGVKQRNQR
jgi:hypothetical protein